ncbi:uncharacterized protein [Nicotiana tomentosiformis]|uniref:uncharacterized protein n=1 Tax=Nicotiana tomentosiformis TaxID=4098 RepID=UPI00388CC24E
MTIRVYHKDIGKHIVMIFVYAKGCALESLELWDNLYYFASDMKLPWLVGGGDFNVVLSEEERIGGFPVYPSEYEDFVFCINSCGLFDLGYKSSPFTWWNGRPNEECIFKRLDRIPLAIKEDVVRFKEMMFEEDPSVESRIVLQQAQLEIKKCLSIEEKYWKQKTGSKNSDVAWIESQELLSNAAVEFFQKQFTKEDDPTSFNLLHNVPSMVTMEQNLELCRLPTRDEVNAIVFALSSESVSGPDDIRLRGKPVNVVIKMDMEKAYDKVSWKYLMHVLRKMGGVKQGDPLSPALFILSAEVLSRSLNKLFEDKQFRGFGMPKWTDPLDHLAYADDTIIFASADPYSLQKIVYVLAQYEHSSRQLINKANSSYYMYANVVGAPVNTVGNITRFSKGEFTFTYHGCPIFYTRRRKEYYTNLIQKVKAKLHSWKREEYYEDLVKKVKDKLHAWKGKLLSFGGKATLITGVLQSMLVHLLSVLDTPDNILEHLHKIFARFFWSTNEEGRSRHWSSWQNLCLPKEEGGLGFRSLHDVSRDLFANIWQGSHVWRKILNDREEVEHGIMWERKSGTTNIWHENWTRLGALYHVLPQDFPINEELQEVAELSQGESWNDQLIDQSFPEDIADHIIHNLHYDSREDYWERPYWMPTSSSKFTVSSAWKILRHRADPNQEFKQMCTKDLLCINTIEISDKALVECIMLSKVEATIQVAQAIITWDLWKKRNIGKHGGSMFTNMVIHKVNRTLHQLARCNTDGASKGNPIPSSLGFCVRNNVGDLVYARAVDLGVTTNIVAEAKAILQWLVYCVEHDLHPLILETNYLVLEKVIEGGWDPPWDIVPDVQTIQEMRDNFNVIFQHVFIEGNTLAYFIANILISFMENWSFLIYGVGWRFMFVLSFEMQNLAPGESNRGATLSATLSMDQQDSLKMGKHTIKVVGSAPLVVKSKQQADIRAITTLPTIFTTVNSALQATTTVDKISNQAPMKITTEGKDKIPGHGIQNSGKTSEAPSQEGAQYNDAGHVKSGLQLHISDVQHECQALL